jgi:hypothetical protein
MYLQLHHPYLPKVSILIGGFNHCRSHCCLAELRGLMYRGKDSAVIGVEEPIAWKLIQGS